MNKMLFTPVLFIIFNRPDTTQRVFNAIREAKPTRLFVAADGPRDGNDSDVEKCLMAREIVKQVDWNCEVKMLFRDKNLGCKVAVSSAIDWFFDNVEEGIVLEDDCLPHITFFQFCHELLEKYRNDNRIMAISGDNFQPGRKRTGHSYYFAHYPFIWGWATWRRAWLYYDKDMKIWPEIKDKNYLKDILVHSTAIGYWSNIFQTVYECKIDTWDYQWSFTCWIQNGLTIVPSANLVSNIGSGPEATHTKELGRIANLDIAPMEFPLKPPSFVIRDSKYDEFVDKKVYHNTAYWTLRRTISKTWVGKIFRSLKKILSIR
jgi:hypothetical protein